MNAVSAKSSAPLVRPTEPLALAFYALLAIIPVSMIWIDRALALYLHDNLPAGLFDFFKLITDIGKGNGWYMGAGIALAIGLAGGRLAGVSALGAACNRLWRSALYLLGALLVSGIFVPVGKILIGRLRPKFLFNEGLYGLHPFTFDLGSVSFPSGHAQTIFAVMTALWVLYPRPWPIYAAVAVAVALSRVFTGVHFFADVLAGAFIGVAGSLLLQRWLERRGIVVRLSGPAGG